MERTSMGDGWLFSRLGDGKGISKHGLIFTWNLSRKVSVSRTLLCVDIVYLASMLSQKESSGGVGCSSR